MKTLLYILPAAAILAGSAAFAADAQSTGEIARSGQAPQEEIQGDSRKLVAEIDATIDEYERNGLKGEEIDNLKKLRQTLSGMSDRDMAKILDLLQQAGAKGDPKAALKALVDAYSAQKGVLSQLQRILNDYAADEDALNLAKQARALADRQAINLQTGIETAQWALRGGDKDDNTTAADFSMQAQAAEQKAIADAVKQLQSKIAALAANPDNQALAERFKKGLEEIAALNPVLDAAGGLLDQKKLFDAAASEKIARDGLRQLARTISPPRDEEDALRDASDQLDKIIALQKDVRQTTDSDKIPPIEQWIAAMLKVRGNVLSTATRLHHLNMNPAQLALMDEYKSLYKEQFRLATIQLTGLDNQQGDIINQTDSLSQDVASVSKPVADSLQSAMPPMQTARGQLVDGDGVNAVSSETVALEWLEKAKAYLDGRLADLEKADKEPDTATAPGDLQKQAQDLIAEQKAISDSTVASNTPQQAAALAQQQAALQQKTQDLQQAAAAGSPAAAQSLDAAAKNMQQAAAAMNTPGQTAQAQAQQQQAMQNLAAAGQQLGQQAAQAQQAEQQAAQQAAADQKALDALAKIIENELKLQVDTLDATPKQQKQPALVSALAPRQQGIRQDTDDFQKTLGAQAGAGADPQLITSAGNHMGDAYGHLGKADGALAAPDEKKALDDLYAAQKAMQAAMDAAQNQAGQDQTPQQQAQTDQAAAAIAQAQQQVAQAQNALNQQTAAGQQAAANDFGQAATATGDAAAQGNALPGDAQQALQNASQALAQASGQAAAGQDAQAQGNGQQAQAALAQAQAALAQAQAGLADNGQGQGQGQDPGMGQGQAGQGQGQAGQGQGQAGQGQGQAGQGQGQAGQGQGQAGQGQGQGGQGQGQGGQGQGQGGQGQGQGGQGQGQGGQGQGGQGQGQGSGGTGSGGGGNTQIAGAQTQGNGQRAASKAQFVGLPARDRATIEQSQAEKYPQQYSTKVEQYLQNLADGSAKQ